MNAALEPSIPGLCVECSTTMLPGYNELSLKLLGAVITYRQTTHRQNNLRTDNSPTVQLTDRQLTDSTGKKDNSPTVLVRKTTHRQRQLTDRARGEDNLPTMTTYRQL